MGMILDSNGEFIAKKTGTTNIIICYDDDDILRFRKDIKFNFRREGVDKDGNEYRVVEGFSNADEIKNFINNIDVFRTEANKMLKEKDQYKTRFSISRSFKYSKATIAKKIVDGYFKKKGMPVVTSLNTNFTFTFPKYTDLRFYSMMENYYNASFCISMVDNTEIFENVYYRDFTQHYTSILAERPMPYYAKRISKRSELPEHWFGCWRIDVDMDDYERLPQKLKELIQCRNCRLAVTEMDKEVYEALGIRFVECLRLYEVKLAPISEIFPALRQQIDNTFMWRKCIKEKLEKDENNEFLKFQNEILKLANEKFYGDCVKRFFMLEKRVKNVPVQVKDYHKYFFDISKRHLEYDEMTLEEWLTEKDHSYCSVWQYNEAWHLFKQTHEKRGDGYISKLPKMFGIYILSYSRHDQMEIVNYILRCGGRCLYTDTDSFFYQCDYDCLDGFRDKKKGDYDFLKLEHYFTKAKFAGKKWWIGEYTKDNESKIKYAAAGATGLIDGTTVENFGSKRGIFPTVRAKEAVEEWLKEKIIEE